MPNSLMTDKMNYTKIFIDMQLHKVQHATLFMHVEKSMLLGLIAVD